METRPLELNPEKGYAIYQAFVYNAKGRLMATRTKMETVAHFGDVGAHGRAPLPSFHRTLVVWKLPKGPTK